MNGVALAGVQSRPKQHARRDAPRHIYVIHTDGPAKTPKKEAEKTHQDVVDVEGLEDGVGVLLRRGQGAAHLFHILLGVCGGGKVRDAHAPKTDRRAHA